jgi:two-component sensor histidine kinase
LDWRWGGLALVGSALVANYMFQPPAMTFTFRPQELVGTAAFVASGALIVSAAEGLRRSVLELAERTQREAELNLELQHRVNNNLTVIQGLARLMLRHAQTPEGYYAAFSERLLAISEANQILSRHGWEIAVLPELVETALKPFKTKGRIELDGPPCQLPTRSCVPLVLALHELSTNAVKYGALSVADGCVRVRWTVEGGRCRLTWREENGPPVPPPTRQGLGSRLLRPQPGLETITLMFPPTGAVCEMIIEGAELL